MSDAAILEAVQVLNPRTIDRARRLARAIDLLNAGATRGEASKAIQQRFGVCQSTAWRVVDIAADLAGRPADERKVATP